MKLNVFKSAKQNTTYLQGFGHVEGTPAGDLKVGSTMVWNNGIPSTVVAIVKETEKTITVLEKYEDKYSPTGFSTYERKLLKSRIVARPVHELNGTEEKPEDEPSGVATSRQNDDRLFDRLIPYDEDEVPSESAKDVVLITEGPEVDLVTDLFNKEDREKLLNSTWEEASTNATEVSPQFYEKIASMLTNCQNHEEDFDRLAAAFSPVAGPQEEEDLYPGYYPNQITFDRVVSLYPGSKVVAVEEFFTLNIGWRKPEDVVGKNALSYWAPEELVQYLKDKFDGSSFCLIVEGKDGRRKNPDYKYRELTVGLEPGDAVLYLPDLVRGDRSNPAVERGIVSSVRVEEGRASVWVRYTTGETGVLTNLSNLVRESCSKSCSPGDFCAGGKCDSNGCFNQ